MGDNDHGGHRPPVVRPGVLTALLVGLLALLLAALLDL
jgi:hypothetical protein